MDHAWNLVKVDGKFLHVDCTWDDPIGGSPDDTYFLLTDKEMLARKHHDWVDVTALVRPNRYAVVTAFFVSLAVLFLSVVILFVRIAVVKKHGKNTVSRGFGRCSDEELLLAMARANALLGSNDGINDGINDEVGSDRNGKDGV